MSLGLTIVPALALVGFPTSGAVATNFSGATGNIGCNWLNKGDTSLHTFYYDNVSNQVTNVANAARNQDIEASRVDTELLSSVSASTDVIVGNDYYSGTICGVAWSGIVGVYLCSETDLGN